MGEQHRCTFCHKLGARLKFATSNPRPPRPHATNGRTLAPRPRHDFYAHTRCYVEQLGAASLIKLPTEALGDVDPSELSASVFRTILEKMRAADRNAARAVELAERATKRQAERDARATLRADTQLARDLNARCPSCKVEPGKPCVSRNGREMRTVHPARRRLARKASKS
jgi:phage FluMu protein Com